MNSKYKIVQYPKGFVVEIQKKKWFGKKYWTHFITVRGMESEPWYHSTFDFAMESLLDKIKDDTMWNSQYIEINK